MTVLFTPLGLAYGTLYSAIMLVRPRRLVAVADSDNIINLTGGTTALQDCVRSVADILRAQHRAVREVAVIDRRPTHDQKRSPLVVGELVEVSPV